MASSKLTWHSDSDEDDLGAPNGGAPQPGASRFNRVVVLKGMFKLEDLDKEPELLLELKEDVREEAETMGQVTSVILYDVSGRGIHHGTATDDCLIERGGWRDDDKVQRTNFGTGLCDEDERTILRWSQGKSQVRLTLADGVDIRWDIYRKGEVQKVWGGCIGGRRERGEGEVGQFCPLARRWRRGRVVVVIRGVGITRLVFRSS